MKNLIGVAIAGLWLGFVAVLSLCNIGPALAQALPVAAPSGGVDFGPLATNIISACVMIATIGAGIVGKFVISFLASKVHMQDSAAEKLAADRVNDILYRAIDYAEAWSKAQVGDPTSQIHHVKIDNFFLAKALEFSISAMPDLIKLFGLTNEKIEAMILSRANAIMVKPAVNSGTPISLAELSKPDPVKAAIQTEAVKTSSEHLEETKADMGKPSSSV